VGRDRGNIRVDIWSDDHWRSLSPGAQWLYLHLLTAPTLNYVGVADWRPARISALSHTLTRKQVESWGDELESERFIFRDDDTEEVFVRSFMRHDGLLVNPNLWKSVGKDFGAVGSNYLRAKIAHEARRLRDESPDGWETKSGGKRVDPWGSPHLRTMLATPSDRESDRGSSRGSDSGPPTTTSTSTDVSYETSSLSPDESADLGTLIPDDWRPNQSHVDRANSLHLDVRHEYQRFRARSVETHRRLKNWNTGFTNWLRKSAEFNQQRQGGQSPRLSKADQNAAEYARLYGGQDERAGGVPALDARVG